MKSEIEHTYCIQATKWTVLYSAVQKEAVKFYVRCTRQIIWDYLLIQLPFSPQQEYKSYLLTQVVGCPTHIPNCMCNQALQLCLTVCRHRVVEVGFIVYKVERATSHSQWSHGTYLCRMKGTQLL